MKADFSHFKIKNLILEILALLVLAAMFVFVISNWRNIPETIPSHFDFQGQVDGWSGRGSILFLPFLSLGMELLMTFIAFYPRIWNTPVQLNEKNREVIVALSLELIEYIKLLCFIMFYFILWHQVTFSASAGASSSAGFVGLFILLIFGVIAYYTYRMVSYNKKINDNEQEW